MSFVSDVIEALKGWKKWQEIEALPARLASLEQRIAELESTPQRAAGEACPRCGAYAFRVTESKDDPTFGRMGGRRQTLRCGDCGFEDERLVTPK